MSEAGTSTQSPPKSTMAATGAGGDLSKRACDQCKFRKIRCSKTQPCATCTAMDLNCTYIAPRKKRGPPGKRVGEIQRQQRLSARGGAGIVKRENSYGRSLDSSIDGLLYFTQYDSSSPNMESNINNNNNTIPESFMPLTSYEDAHSVLSAGSLQSLDGTMNSYTYTHSPTPTSLTDGSGGPFGSPPFFDLEDENTSHNTNIRSDQLNVYNQGMANMGLNPYATADGSNQYGGNELMTRMQQPTNIWPVSIDDSSLLPLIDIWFDRLHATIPVLNRTSLYQRLMDLEHRRNKDFAAMLLALCAFALTQPVLEEERSLSKVRNAEAKIMMQEAVRMQDCADFGEHPTLEATLCSFFLFAVLFGSNQHNSAWLRLREAVTLGDLLRLHDPHSYEQLAPEERACRLRTYWILCVTERAYALQRRHSIEFKGQPGVIMRSMHEYIDRTSDSQIFGLVGQDEMDATGMFGLKQLVDVFDQFSDDILDCWNERCNGAGSCQVLTPERIVALHHAQMKIYNAWDEGTDNNLLFPVQAHKQGGNKPGMCLKETQKADVLITRQWLLNRLWQLSFSHRLLVLKSPHPELQFDYAETIAMNTLQVCRGLSLSSMEVHGVGLVEKLYDIASCAITASSCFPSDINSNLTYEQQAYFAGLDTFPAVSNRSTFTSTKDMAIRVMIDEFYVLFTEFRAGDHPYLPKLMKRMEALPPLPETAKDDGIANPSFTYHTSFNTNNPTPAPLPVIYGGEAEAQNDVWSQATGSSTTGLYCF